MAIKFQSDEHSGVPKKSVPATPILDICVKTNQALGFIMKSFEMAHSSFYRHINIVWGASFVTGVNNIEFAHV